MVLLYGEPYGSKKRINRMARGKPEEIYSYLFSKEQCVNCPHRKQCMGKSKNKARKLQVALSAPIICQEIWG